jgi:hypothetical protein
MSPNVLPGLPPVGSGLRRRTVVSSLDRLRCSMDPMHKNSFTTNPSPSSDISDLRLADEIL